MSGKPFARVDPGEYQRLDLHAHALLVDAPLHDAWRVELPGGPPDCTIDLLRAHMSFEAVAKTNWIVRALFGLRLLLGRVFRWDGAEMDRSGSAGESRETDGPFEIVYKSDVEAVGEIENKTVHAWSVMALVPGESGYRFYWAIHVAPVGRITGFYMALIDPFRRLFVYPAILGHVHRSWVAEHGG